MAFSFYSRWYAWRRTTNLALVAYWRYRTNRWYLISSLVLQALLWFFAYRLQTVVGADSFVAHYNVDFGIDAIGGSGRAFNVPLLGLAVLLVNNFILISFSRRQHFHFFTHAFGLTTVLVQVLGALALMSLYLINFLA